MDADIVAGGSHGRGGVVDVGCEGSARERAFEEEVDLVGGGAISAWCALSIKTSETIWVHPYLCTFDA